MTQAAPIQTTQDAPGPVTSRAGLARFMRRICSEIGADRYMLVEPSVERGPKSVRIITSNWIFDALEELGTAGIAAILESDHAAGAGMQPRVIVTAEAAFLSSEERRALRDHGHAELYCQKLDVSGSRIFALFSGEVRHCINAVALLRAHMACRYALNQFFAATSRHASRDPLSERERECLAWVSQGKTTDEVAVILGVSSNTVNSYVAHAIQKFGASNRAMAIATAIRSGII
jgi:DNA-binding CsgD family transcriptional regulator